MARSSDPSSPVVDAREAPWPIDTLAEPAARDHELPAVVGIADLRATNAAAVLAVVRSAERHPRLATLAAVTKLSRPTVEAIVEELTDCGLIEVAPAVSTRGQRSPGRPARRFRFRPHAGFVVGVDVRAGSVSACLADLDGRAVAVARRAVRADLTGPARARAVTTVVDTAIERADVDARRVWAATVGTPGLVNRTNTRVRQADNLRDWAGTDIVGILRETLGCPVAVENDANLAALGEQWRGVGGAVDEMAFVLLGERLGAGVITGRRLLRGHHGAAGEVGFIRFPGSTPPGPGLESLMPGTAGAELVRGAAAGELPAVEAVRAYGRRLAEGLAPVLLALDPEVVVLGTGPFPAAESRPAAELLLAAAAERAGALLVDPPRWRLSTLGDEAVITGAVRFALSSVESVLRTRPTSLAVRV